MLDDGDNKSVQGVMRAGAREWLSVENRIMWKSGKWGNWEQIL